MIAAVGSPDRFTVGFLILVVAAALVLGWLWHRVAREDRLREAYDERLLADLKRRAREVGVG